MSAGNTQSNQGDVVVDVIVATRNRHDDLARMLASLQNQSLAAMRVLVIDQSDDVTPNRTAVAKLDDPRFEHVEDRARGKSQALNLGLARTSSALIASTDDDCVADPTWLEELVAAATDHPSAGVVFGDLVPAPHNPVSDFIPSIEFDGRKLIDQMPAHWPGMLGMGGNMLLRRSALVEVGLFDTDLGPGGRLRTGEETELTFRLLRKGFAVVQQPAARVIHYGARPIVDGAAGRLVNDCFFAGAAGLGKHVRAGDLVALRAFAQQLADAFRQMSFAAAQRQRPYHLRRIATFHSGFFAGFRAGPAIPKFDMGERLP